MKTLFLVPGALLLATMAFVTGCDNDAYLATDGLPSASFASSNFSFGEADGEQIVTLHLDKAAADESEVIVKFWCNGSAPVSVEPTMSEGNIHVRVPAGQTSVDIKVLPVNNTKLDGTRNATLSILSVEGTYRVGFLDRATLTIADDESPSRVEFTSREASLAEGETGGFQIDMRLSAAAPAAGIVIIEAETDSRYSTDFVTIPSVVNGKIYLPVAEGQTYVRIGVYASNDNVKQADRQIIFRLSDASGGVMRDGYTGSFQLRIVEDDSNASLLPMRPIESEEKLE